MIKEKISAGPHLLHLEKAVYLIECHLFLLQFSSVQWLSHCLTLCNCMNHSTPGLPVHHQLPESTQTHVHWVSLAFFDVPVDVGHLIAGSSAFSKTSLNIWKFTVHVLLKPGFENFEHYFTSVWDECNCVVVWAFFGRAFLWDWDENWPFPVLWPRLSFPNFLAYWVQHFHSSIFQDLK